MRRVIAAGLLLCAGLAAAEDVAEPGAKPSAENPQPIEVTENQTPSLTVEALNAWARSAADVLTGAPRLTESQRFELDGLTLALGEGRLFPIQSGGPPRRGLVYESVAPEDPALQAALGQVGFVWLGEGTVDVDLQHDNTGAWLANWQHRVLGTPSPALVELAAGRLQSAVTAVVVTSVDPQLIGFIDALPPAPDAKTSWEAIGAGARRPDAQAMATLRVRQELLGAPGATLPTEVHVQTSTRFGVVRPHAGGSERAVEEDRWLVWTRSDDDPHRYQLFTAGEAPGEATSWVPLAQVPQAPDAPLRGGVEAVDADVTLVVEPTQDQLYVEVVAEATLTLRALADTRYVALSMPSTQARPDSFRLRHASLDDGTPLHFVPHPKGRYRASRVHLALPREVAAGETIRVELAWEGTWPFDYPGLAYAGTGLQDLLPSPYPQQIGAPWRFTARVGVPEDAKLEVALTGVTQREWIEEGGLRWVEARQETPGLWPSVSIGRWVSLTAPGTTALPALSVRIFESQAEALPGFATEVARALTYFQRFLPPYPFEELEIAQAPDQLGGFTWIAPHGVVNVQQGLMWAGANALRAEKPHLESGVLAHELGHGWFGHYVVPASTEDFWVAETFSEILACMYLAETFGAEDCAARMQGAAQVWSRQPQVNASLTRAYRSRAKSNVVYRYGPYVIHHMLRSRLDDDAAYLAALKQLVGDTPGRVVRTADVQAAFERASGRSWADFFDFWVRGGFIPQDLELLWRAEPSEAGWMLSGELVCDVPFGRFDLPVLVRDAAGGYHKLFIDVIDGSGSFELGPLPGRARPTVTVDPSNLTLAGRKRATRLR